MTGTLPDLTEILSEAYRSLCARAGWKGDAFPLPLAPQEDGIPFLEVGPDGAMAIVARDRGRETSRVAARDVDELMYHLAAMRVRSRAFHADPGRAPYDYEGRKAAALAEMARLSEDWRARLDAEMRRAG